MGNNSERIADLKNDRRKNDVQYGRLIEKVDNLEKSIEEFKIFVTSELRSISSCAATRWDTLNKHFGHIGNKLNKEEFIEDFIPVKSKVNQHAIYWKVLIGVIITGLSIIKILDWFLSR